MIIAGLDIETTGLSAEKGHRIIELATTLHDSNTGKLVGKWAPRINPKRSIDPKAQAVHGISLDDLKECPPWEEVAPKLIKLLKKVDLVVAHNGDGFDFPFIIHEIDRLGLELPDVETFDTMVNGYWATPDGKPPSLRELAQSLGYIYDESKAHGALYDTALMMQCFFKARRAYGLFQTSIDK
ncbi:exonuclease [Halomonas sp. S2151]|uniref:3'-5' exonuclease n=1 Tax=Halomonas sp. S2151 TaxID=579478 RepID=UPI0005FA5E5B|nr:3'-5' exonuclease [Halomonas sp. S2151]KJZ17381.1 exonuclease [Halomonas sp. S2151]